MSRLLRCAGVSALLDEIVRTSGVVVRAESVEFVPQHVPLRTHNDTCRVRRWRRAFAIQAGNTQLGRLQVGWSRPPSQAALQRLRQYLHHTRDALQRALREDTARHAALRAERLLEILPDACVLILSRRGVVRSIHGEAQDLLGSPPLAVGATLLPQPGKPPPLALPRRQLQQLFVSAQRSGRAESETVLRDRERKVPVQVTLLTLAPGSEMLCVLRDLTEVKAMEQALLRRNDELRMAAERLKEVDMLKNEFLSNVSHELRTPLTAIIAYSEALVLTKPDTKTLHDFLNVIVEQGHKLQGLIGGLLDIAKLESLATELKLAPGSLNDVVKAAVVTVRPLAEKSGIDIVLDLAPELPQTYLDELRSQQIVWNLLTNALKFSPAHSTVTVRTWEAGGAVWASVRDQGIGIDPEHQELIFEKFVQVDGSTTRRHGGVGLGLDLVRHLVQLHGGRVSVESRPGEGAVFSFNIPIEKRSRPRLGDRSHHAVETS